MVNALTLLQWQHILSSEQYAGIKARNLTVECVKNSHVGNSAAMGKGVYTTHSAIFDALSDAIWELDEHFNIVYCNAAALSLCDANTGFINRPINAVLPVYADKDFQPSITHRTEDFSDEIQVYFWSADSKYVSLDIHGLIHKNLDGSTAGYTVITKPGTPRPLDRGAAGVSEVQWHHLYETYPEPIAVISESRFIYVNAACAELYGATHKAQLIGKTLYEFALVPYHKVLKKRLEIIASGERTTPIESRIRRLDGHVRYVRTYSVPIDYGGQKAGQIVISDITEQKRALRALERSEKRFKALFERAGIGILLATHDARILDTNPSFQRMVGYSAEELREMSTNDITHHEDFPIQSQFYRQIHQGKIDRYRLEKRYLHRDNYIVWGSLTMAVIRDESGAC